MSINYIGRDVHQATIVIVVVDQAGKRVMETIIETRAWTIVQLLRGLEGSLYVTFEEGTYADWLYDLLTPYVEKLVVWDPRKNKLLPAGHKSDKADARKLAEGLRRGELSPVYHGSRSLRTLQEPESQLPVSGPGHHPSHEPIEGLVSRTRHRLQRPDGLPSPAPRAVAEAADGSGSAPARGVALPTAGSVAAVAQGGSPGSADRKPPSAIASDFAPDSRPGADAGGLARSHRSDAPSLSQQTAILELRRLGGSDS
jgi:hypothetical protein